MTFEIILGMILAGILSNNYPLIECLGTGAVLENERSNKRSVVLGLLTTVIMLVSLSSLGPSTNFFLQTFPIFRLSFSFVLFW